MPQPSFLKITALAVSLLAHVVAGYVVVRMAAMPTQRVLPDAQPTHVARGSSGGAIASGHERPRPGDLRNRTSRVISSLTSQWSSLRNALPSWLRGRTAGSTIPNEEWRDRSPHTIRMVTVGEGVRVEVLDWGGSGTQVLLLADVGNTAHVYDEFAPKLADCCHAFAMTRRGYGASSRPETGYEQRQLADDVLGVLDSLSLGSVVLIGHGIAGGEITSLAARHPDRVSSLVYLDALADPQDSPDHAPGYASLYEKLPLELRSPAALDFSSYGAYRVSQMKTLRFVFPESEVRQLFTQNPDGTIGEESTPRSIGDRIIAGQQARDYSGIHAPVLALLEFPRVTYDPKLDRYLVRSNDERVAIEQMHRTTGIVVARWMNNLKDDIPNARFVDLPGAGHYLYLTREAGVSDQIQKFVADVAVSH